jgi:nitrous oxidase accessory protein NosD
VGIVLDYAPNDHSIIPIVFNFMGCSFTHLQSGLIYGGNCQGVSVLYCNFTSNFVGIIVPVTAVAVDQLLINSCQFNNINDSILFQVWCQAVSIVNSFFLVTDNAVGIAVNQMANLSITGNNFQTSDGTPVNQQGVQIGTYSQGAAIITGNQFNGLTVGVALLAASQKVNVQSNCYVNNGTNVNNAGTGNTVGGGSQ